MGCIIPTSVCRWALTCVSELVGVYDVHDCGRLDVCIVDVYVM